MRVLESIVIFGLGIAFNLRLLGLGPSPCRTARPEAVIIAIRGRRSDAAVAARDYAIGARHAR
jgi:hypothetical protein